VTRRRDYRGRRARRWRVDPFCWPAAGSMLLIGVIGFVSDFPPLGIVLCVLAVGMVVLDGWINRDRRPARR
jgi:hypothetical protein